MSAATADSSTQTTEQGADQHREANNKSNTGRCREEATEHKPIPEPSEEELLSARARRPPPSYFPRETHLSQPHLPTWVELRWFIVEKY